MSTELMFELVEPYIFVLLHFSACVYAQWHLNYCNCVDYSPTGSSVLGIPQARILEGLPFPSPGEFLNPGIKPRSPALAGRFFTTVLVHCDVKVKKYQDIGKRVVCMSEQ